MIKKSYIIEFARKYLLTPFLVFLIYIGGILMLISITFIQGEFMKEISFYSLLMGFIMMIFSIRIIYKISPEYNILLLSFISWFLIIFTCITVFIVYIINI